MRAGSNFTPLTPGMEVGPADFIPPPFAQFHLRNVVALARNLTRDHTMEPYLVPKMGIELLPYCRLLVPSFPPAGCG